MRALWLITALLGMTAATLTWIIGFPLAAVAYAGSVPTTTLALAMGVGSYLLTNKRHRRWSWLLVAVPLAIGPFLRGAWMYFVEGPLEIGLACLLCALIAALTEPRARSARSAEGGDDG
jgi:uncharacterized membrane protein